MSRKDNSGWIAALAIFGGLLLLSSSSEAEDKDKQLKERLRRLYLRAAALLGVQPPSLVFTSNIDNAASNGVSVLVNLVWFREMLQRFCDHQSCSEVVVLGIMGHELAHHVNQDAFSKLNRKERELRADSWAGVVLARAGVDPCDFERVLNELSCRDSKTHPDGPDRVVAIRRGYLKAKGK